MKLKNEVKKLEDMTNVLINTLIKTYDLDKYEVTTNYLRNYQLRGAEVDLPTTEEEQIKIGYDALKTTIIQYHDIYGAKLK